MSDVLQLGPRESVENRPFTDVAHSDQDLAAMQRILASLVLLVNQPLTWPEPPKHLVVRGDDAGKVVRVVVCNRESLLDKEPRFVVAFFGHRRAELDTTMLSAVDDDLIHEFAMHPGVLSYSSFELDDGNYVNVVVLKSSGDKDNWRTSPRHAYAVNELAPEFYGCIRLQNAVLPHGLTQPDELLLVTTKYYDYATEPPWLALREVL